MTGSPRRMAGEVEVRPARADDAAAVGAAFDAAVLAGWRYFDDGDGTIEDLVPMFGPDHWDAAVADVRAPDILDVAVEAAGEVVGFVATHVSPEDARSDDEGELYLLFVHPDAAGLGVGRLLLDHAHASLRGHGCRRVYLFTHELNTRARAVYEAAGYRTDGGSRCEEFRGRRLREVRMVAPLLGGSREVVAEPQA